MGAACSIDVNVDDRLTPTPTPPTEGDVSSELQEQWHAAVSSLNRFVWAFSKRGVNVQVFEVSQPFMGVRLVFSPSSVDSHAMIHQYKACRSGEASWSHLRAVADIIRVTAHTTDLDVVQHWMVDIRRNKRKFLSHVRESTSLDKHGVCVVVCWNEVFRNVASQSSMSKHTFVRHCFL